MGKFARYKMYTKTLLKYYFTQKPKLAILVVLSLLVFIWISLTVHRIMINPVYSAERTGLVKLGEDGFGLLILFIKPFFVYIAGLLILKQIKEEK